MTMTAGVLPERYEQMIDDMMRRASKAGRAGADDLSYEVTASDAKKLGKMGFPKVLNGRIIDYVPEERKIIVTGKETKPKRSTAGKMTEGISDVIEEVFEPVLDPEPVEEPVMSVEIPEDTEPLDEEEAPEVLFENADLLMWVGYSGYPTIDKYVAEAEMQGVSKRISKFPREVYPGYTRVFLAHDEGVKGDAVIFGYFIVEAIEVIVHEADDVDPNLLGRVRPVLLSDAHLEQERGCGHRDSLGAYYLVNYSMAELEARVKEFDLVGGYEISGGLVLFDEPRDYNAIIDPDGQRFRNFRRVDGDAIMVSKSSKKYPRARAKRTINIPEDRMSRPKRKWTEEESSELARLVSERDSLYQAFKEFERQTNRSFRGVEYHYFKHIKGKEASKA